MSGKPFDQRLADRVISVLARTPITPNMVTSFGLVCGIVAAVLYATGRPFEVNVAAAVFMIAMFTDHLDGGLARATGRTSKFGHYYDRIAIGVSYIGMFLGAGIGFERHGGLGEWAPAVGTVAGISVTVIFMARITIEARGGQEFVKQNNYGGFEVEDIMYVVGPVTWLGFLEHFLIAAAIGAPLFLFWSLRRSLRELARAARGRGAS